MSDSEVVSADKEVKLADGDYVLVDGGAWFTVKGFAVRIRSHGPDLDGYGAIAVDVYYNNENDLDVPIDTLTVSDYGARE